MFQFAQQCDVFQAAEALLDGVEMFEPAGSAMRLSLASAYTRQSSRRVQIVR